MRSMSLRCDACLTWTRRDDLGEHAAVGRFDPRSKVTIGDAIEIAVNTGNLHFFDPQSRTAIW